MLFKDLSTSDTESDNVLPLRESKGTSQIAASWIDYAGLINRQELLIVGWVYHPTESDLELELSTDTEEETFEISILRGKRPDVCMYQGEADLNKQLGFAIIARLIGGKRLDGTATLELRVGSEKLEHTLENLGPLDPDKIAPPVGGFSREQRVFIYRRIIEDADPLFIRQMATTSGSENRSINIDNAVSLQDGFFINGWFDNTRDDLIGIYLLAGNSLSKNLVNEISSYRRQDIIDAFNHVPADYEAGLFAYVPLENEAQCKLVEVVALTDQGKLTKVSIRCAMLNGNEINLTQTVLRDVDIHSPDLGNIFARHIDPVLCSIWRERLSTEKELETFEFGDLPADPKRTVIVPVYGRYDLLMYQLAQFASDPDFRETDLLYVLDDPRIKKDFLRLCEDCSRIFGVPFRVVTSGRNQGFACANNLGAKHARSDLLVLMNSDVMPQEPGWLDRLQEQYEALENPGAVGVRLVYDDGTIQHDGMTFVESPEYPSLWLNDHPNKGLPPWLADEPGVRELPAITAALMMVGRDRYEEAGGLDPAYILGDFEDSDFCLKLREKGYKNYLVSTVRLYHLERQSQNLVHPGDWKHKLTIFNAWQHTNRWGETIQTLNSSQS